MTVVDGGAHKLGEMMNSFLAKLESIEQALEQRFGDMIHEDPLTLLLSLKQIGTVAEFFDQFEFVLFELEIPEKQAVKIFIEALKPSIQIYVSKFQPATLSDALVLAEFEESKILNSQLNVVELVEQDENPLNEFKIVEINDAYFVGTTQFFVALPANPYFDDLKRTSAMKVEINRVVLVIELEIVNENCCILMSICLMLGKKEKQELVFIGFRPGILLEILSTLFYAQELFDKMCMSSIRPLLAVRYMSGIFLLAVQELKSMFVAINCLTTAFGIECLELCQTLTRGYLILEELYFDDDLSRRKGRLNEAVLSRIVKESELEKEKKKGEAVKSVVDGVRTSPVSELSELAVENGREQLEDDADSSSESYEHAHDSDLSLENEVLLILFPVLLLSSGIIDMPASSEYSGLASKCLKCHGWSLLDTLTWPVYLVQYFLGTHLFCIVQFKH